MRSSKKITLENSAEFKHKLQIWAQQYHEFVWLDSNDYPQFYSSYDAVLAVDAHSVLQSNYLNAFTKLKNYKNEVNDFIFGYLSYDLKNDTELLSSKNNDGLHFPDLYFFQPKKLFLFKDNVLEIQYLVENKNDINGDLKSIEQITSSQKGTRNDSNSTLEQHNVKIKKRITKKEYLNQ